MLAPFDIKLDLLDQLTKMLTPAAKSTHCNAVLIEVAAVLQWLQASTVRSRQITVD
jgi:hypothetical protein